MEKCRSPLRPGLPSAPGPDRCATLPFESPGDHTERIPGKKRSARPRPKRSHAAGPSGKHLRFFHAYQVKQEPSGDRFPEGFSEGRGTGTTGRGSREAAPLADSGHVASFFMHSPARSSRINAAGSSVNFPVLTGGTGTPGRLNSAGDRGRNEHAGISASERVPGAHRPCPQSRLAARPRA